MVVFVRVLLVALAALAVSPLADGRASSVAAGVCDAHQDAAVRVTRDVIVYRTAAGVNQIGQSVTQYWACARPDGPSMTVGREASGGRYPPNERIGRLTVAGPDVGAFGSFGADSAAACGVDAGKLCPRIHHNLVLDDLATGASTSTGCGPRVGRLLVGSAGAAKAVLVWTQPAGRLQTIVSAETLFSSTSGDQSATGGGGRVAQGTISPRSLRLTGLGLRFTEAGRQRTINLAQY